MLITIENDDKYHMEHVLKWYYTQFFPMFGDL